MHGTTVKDGSGGASSAAGWSGDDSGSKFVAGASATRATASRVKEAASQSRTSRRPADCTLLGTHRGRPRARRRSGRRGGGGCGGPRPAFVPAVALPLLVGHLPHPVGADDHDGVGWEPLI